MPELVSTIGVAVVVFASTNVDDLMLLAAFFADPSIETKTVVAGQFFGIGTLVIASAVAGGAAVLIPDTYIALLGIVPLALGVQRLWLLWVKRRLSAQIGQGQWNDVRAPVEAAYPTHRNGLSQLFAVAGVTVSNGGDNLGVYIPLFATAPRTIPLYVAVFAGMTALWCLAAHALVNNPIIGQHVRRLGAVVLPFVLVALGFWILKDARPLLR